jgi:hypothetical protein
MLIDNNQAEILVAEHNGNFLEAKKALQLESAKEYQKLTSEFQSSLNILEKAVKKAKKAKLLAEQNKEKQEKEERKKYWEKKNKWTAYYLSTLTKKDMTFIIEMRKLHINGTIWGMVNGSSLVKWTLIEYFLDNPRKSLSVNEIGLNLKSLTNHTYSKDYLYIILNNLVGCRCIKRTSPGRYCYIA